MARSGEYRPELCRLADRNPYRQAYSELPGARGNPELGHPAFDVGCIMRENLKKKCMAQFPNVAPNINSPE